MNNNIQRCQWIEGKPDFYVKYHDEVWGKPEHDDRQLFRWLTLEIFHIGLSWQLILSKQAEFDQAFDNFEINKIAQYDEEKINSLLNNTKIVRHRKKIEATINNARAFMTIQSEWGSFDHFIWHFTNNLPVIRREEARNTSSSLSDLVTKTLKTYGFKFIGTVTIYSYLQAVGIINDHDSDCHFR